jgi:release factor glutamine methyltransferase
MEEAWTILRVIQWTAGYFKRKGVEQPRANAEVLLAYILGMERVQLYLHFDKPLSKCELSAYREIVQRRAAREPSQYITLQQEFWSLPFEVNSSVLIPRPETELLVVKALEVLEGGPSFLLDLGTGSGAIAVAVAHEHPRVNVIAADISPKALEVAKRNALRHGVSDRISFVVTDLFSALCTSPVFDVVVSNPPYISDEEFQQLPPEIACHEPTGALKGGGPAGLEVIRRIISDAPRLLKPGGWLLVEIGERQSGVLREELKHNRDFPSFQFLEDYSGILRILSLQRAY